MRVLGCCAAALLLAALLLAAAGAAQAGGTERPGRRRRGLGESAPTPAAALRPVSAMPLLLVCLVYWNLYLAASWPGCTAATVTAAAVHAAGQRGLPPRLLLAHDKCRRMPLTA